MRQSLGKAGVILMLVTASFGLAGCLMNDSSGDADPDVQAPTPPDGNNPPTISGNPPPAVSVGDSYSFMPSASDPDGDTLTFSIQNRPAWANFDSATGRLTGVAPLGSEGIYDDISITVSDGSMTASTRSFSVNVTQASLGSATLSWTPPVANTDGSTLVDLRAYKIYYGTSQGTYPNEIYLDNPGLTMYVVDNLAPDTYYFVSTSVNSFGIESDFSNVATRIVN